MLEPECEIMSTKDDSYSNDDSRKGLVQKISNAIWQEKRAMRLVLALVLEHEKDLQRLRKSGEIKLQQQCDTKDNNADCTTVSKQLLAKLHAELLNINNNNKCSNSDNRETSTDDALSLVLQILECHETDIDKLSMAVPPAPSCKEESQQIESTGTPEITKNTPEKLHYTLSAEEELAKNIHEHTLSNISATRRPDPPLLLYKYDQATPSSKAVAADPAREQAGMSSPATPAKIPTQVVPLEVMAWRNQNDSAATASLKKKDQVNNIKGLLVTADGNRNHEKSEFFVTVQALAGEYSGF